MFVRSRPSRTRAERPIPGDRILDAFDRALIGAHGAALDLVAAYLSRAGTLEADESGRTPGILAVTAAEGGPNALCLSWRRSGPDHSPIPDEIVWCVLWLAIAIWSQTARNPVAATRPTVGRWRERACAQ